MAQTQTQSVPVTVYSKAWCPYCAAAENLLKSKGATFELIDIAMQPDQLGIMLERSGGKRSVPQIFIGEQHIGGYDEMNALDKSGGLDPLLNL